MCTPTHGRPAKIFLVAFFVTMFFCFILYVVALHMKLWKGPTHTLALQWIIFAMIMLIHADKCHYHYYWNLSYMKLTLKMKTPHTSQSKLISHSHSQQLLLRNHDLWYQLTPLTFPDHCCILIISSLSHLHGHCLIIIFTSSLPCPCHRVHIIIWIRKNYGLPKNMRFFSYLIIFFT